MRIIILHILVILLFSVSCSNKSKKSEDLLKMAAFSGMSTSDLPRFGTESNSQSQPESAAVTTTENTEGNTVTSGKPSSIYQNRYLPEDFSLKLPSKPTKGENEVDLSKCYIDQAVELGDVASLNSRLCGVAFDQVKLELHALFLDLALSDIRALCKNKLPTCDLKGKVVDITISEPVMRKIEKLYAFYDYVGLNEYFLYNGYELKNGAKLPFELSVYEEVDHPLFEYRAVVKKRVISTRGTEVEERPGAADITIYWNKTRKNILFQFHGYAEVFDYKISARRVYEYSMPDHRINFTTELNYWSVNSDLAFRFGQAASIRECAKNENCVQHEGIAGFYVGNDPDQNGLSDSEIYYHSLRSSSGVAELEGGIVINSYPETGRLDEQLIYQSENRVSFQLERDGSSLKKWKLANSSPEQSLQELQVNPFWVDYLTEEGNANTNLLSTIVTQKALMPKFPKRIFWQATANPSSPVPLNGYSLTGNQTAIKLQFREMEDSSYRSLYLPDGTRGYILSDF